MDLITEISDDGMTRVYRRELIEIASFRWTEDAHAFIALKTAAPRRAPDIKAPNVAPVDQPIAAAAVAANVDAKAHAFTAEPDAEPQPEAPPAEPAPPPDPYAPEGEAFARLERGEKLGAVADALGLDMHKLRNRWAVAQKALKGELAAKPEPDRGPVMDATRFDDRRPRTEPRPLPQPAVEVPLNPGWVRCARCRTPFNAARSQNDLKLPAPPTRCAGCRS